MTLPFSAGRHAWWRFLPLALVACTSGSPAAGASLGSAALPSPASAPPTTGAAVAELDDMDPRRPLPLRPMMALHQKDNMRDHLAAVQEIVAALASGDFTGVERGAARIGPSSQMSQTCDHMGAAAPGFVTQALAFHEVAGQIIDAAKAQDQGRVLSALGATLQACTGCHATWKQQVVDDDTWQALAAAGDGEPAHPAHAE
jgi:hypothetical protein